MSTTVGPRVASVPAAHPAPRRLETKRMILRCPEPIRDAPEAFAAIAADRDRLHRWLPWVPQICSEAEEQAFLERAEGFWERNEQFNWLMFDRETFAYVGILGTARIVWADGLAELGYWLVSGFEGEGRMTEAVRQVEAPLFAMGLHRLEIRCSSHNQRSAAIPQRLGYHLDGRLREDRVERGQRVDTLIWSKLRSEHGPLIHDAAAQQPR